MKGRLVVALASACRHPYHVLWEEAQNLVHGQEAQAAERTSSSGDRPTFHHLSPSLVHDLGPDPDL